MSDLLKVRVSGSSYLCKWEKKNPFILLNNCRSISQDGLTLYSDYGNDFTSSYSSIITTSSNAFSGDTSIRINSNLIRQDIYSDNFPIDLSNYTFLTFESMISNVTPQGSSWAVTDMNAIEFAVDAASMNSRFGIKCSHTNSYTLYNGASYFTRVGNILYIMSNTYSNITHFAGVFDCQNKLFYGFVNGVLKVTASIELDSFTRDFFGCGTNYVPYTLEFMSIRNGDFSNNLQSFTVPTEKYHL